MIGINELTKIVEDTLETMSKTLTNNAYYKMRILFLKFARIHNFTGRVYEFEIELVKFIVRDNKDISQGNLIKELMRYQQWLLGYNKTHTFIGECVENKHIRVRNGSNGKLMYYGD